ncbi:hypothetical protein DWB68_02800 [Galactobacter valiniphilus]|uniref:Uncharacterized protein n=1 Tax=Galactobacter valiniphilus TaxID=2676122 RepID=A0A399JCH7_9MICC|nr:hypothetical protein [Galactobacter valiniphilus]RII43253.1 hypothetical protein DWB68_02800 [Galactobacter valiniphilus]
MTQPQWDQNPQDPYAQGRPGMLSGAQPGYRPGQNQPGYLQQPYPGAQPMYVDAYGRPVYPMVKQPTPPGNPAMGIWSTILAVAGSVLCLVSFIWIVGQIEQAVRDRNVDGSVFVQSFFSGFIMAQCILGLALLAALVLGIIATATNKGRGWGIGGIVGSVVGPTVAGYIGMMWIAQKAVEWNNAVQSSLGA